MSDNRFNYGGNDYELKERTKFRRKSMFDKNHVTFELILFCLGCVVAFSAGLIGLMKWYS
jgi:hypothetical protein